MVTEILGVAGAYPHTDALLALAGPPCRAASGRHGEPSRPSAPQYRGLAAARNERASDGKLPWLEGIVAAC